MSDDISQKRAEIVDTLIDEMTGPTSSASAVIVEGRLVPRMTMINRGETIDLCLDNRMTWAFPREMAPYVASFAANAMAIGAGFPCFTADAKVAHFATPCGAINLGKDDE